LRLLGHMLGQLLRMHNLTLPFALLVIGFVTRNTRWLKRKIASSAARDWPTVSATIEVVSAVEQIRESRYGDTETTGYVATLSYFYRNPELQMGEYSRNFPLRTSAQRWAEQFKGRQVLVRVNPKDPADSVLLDADLEGLSPAAARSLEETVRLEGLPRLKPGYLLLAGVSEIVAFAGLALSVVGLAVSIRTGSVHWPIWVYWMGGAMIVFNGLSGWIVSYKADDSSSFQSFRKAYKLWCPAWMRWSVTVSGSLLSALWFVTAIAPDLPASVQHLMAWIAPRVLWLVACWLFLCSAAMETAVLRAQELAGPSIGGYPLTGEKGPTFD